MQCNACVEICPVGIEQAPIINQLRRRLVEEGELDPNLQSTLQTIHKSGNSFGENKRRRGRWAKELDFEVPDARKQPVDVLWFVGDYASFDPRSQQVSRRWRGCCTRPASTSGSSTTASATPATTSAGSGRRGCRDARRAEHRHARRLRVQPDRDEDPHSLNTLRNEYPALGGEWPVAHHTMLLLELLREGKLEPQRRLSIASPITTRAISGGSTASTTTRERILELLGARSSRCRATATTRSAAAPAAAGSGSRTARVRSAHRRTGSARPSRSMRSILRRRMPEGRDDVRGRDQDLRQRRSNRAARTDRARPGARSRTRAAVR